MFLAEAGSSQGGRSMNKKAAIASISSLLCGLNAILFLLNSCSSMYGQALLFEGPGVTTIDGPPDESVGLRWGSDWDLSRPLTFGNEIEKTPQDPAQLRFIADEKSAASSEENNGTNPAQAARTFIVSNEFFSLRGGNEINTTYIRMKIPAFGGRGSLLVEAPFVFYDFRATAPGLPQIGGLGDIKISPNYQLWQSESKRLTAVALFSAYLPTADNAIVTAGPTGNELTAFNLGTGKYVLSPGLALVYAISPTFFIAPTYAYEASAFGNENRPDISRGKWRIFAMKAFKNGTYVLPEFQVVTNYLSGNNDVYLAPELGLSRKGTVLYCKPGFGAAPDIGDRDWGLDLGIRAFF
jgi:hypothetical protein